MKRLIAIGITGVAGLIALVPLAGGHATISMLQPQGKALTSARVAYILRAPNEKAAQATWKVVLNVPEALQRSISVKAMADWKITLTRRDTGEKNAEGSPIFATERVTWVAKKGNAIRPGFYGEWYFRAQNPAAAQRLCFPIEQWYNAKKRGGTNELVSWSGASGSATPASCVDVVAN